MIMFVAGLMMLSVTQPPFNGFIVIVKAAFLLAANRSYPFGQSPVFFLNLNFILFAIII